jgi:hypothetical protein
MTTIIVGISIALVVFSVLYVFSTFKYEMCEDNLIIKWKLLKYIPFNSRKINIDNIQTINKFIFKKDTFCPTDIWGNLFIKKGFIVILKKGFLKRVYITRDNPALFVDRIKKIGDGSGD